MHKYHLATKRVILSAIVLLGLVGYSGRDTAGPSSSALAQSPATSASPGSGTPLNADEAEDLVEEAFDRDATLKPFDLDADEKNAGIALEGTVQTEEQKARAEQIAKQTVPGIQIDNLIRVGAKPADADEAEDRVDDALEADNILKAFDLEADNENESILLKGTVRTEAQKTRAEELAKKVAPGFTFNNQILVQ